MTPSILGMILKNKSAQCHAGLKSIMLWQLNFDNHFS